MGGGVPEPEEVAEVVGHDFEGAGEDVTTVRDRGMMYKVVSQSVLLYGIEI